MIYAANLFLHLLTHFKTKPKIFFFFVFLFLETVYFFHVNLFACVSILDSLLASRQKILKIRSVFVIGVQSRAVKTDYFRAS